MIDTKALFDQAWAEEVENRRKQSPSFDLADYTVTGRAAAKYGGKRNADWWADNGPKLVQNWIDWRLKTRWALWETPEGNPGIELELNINLPGDIPVKMFIDRVFVTPVGELAIVDLKGLATETPLATPSGWTTMAAVQVGDEVFGTNGRPCKVTAKSGVKFMDCFRVHFDDGTSIICDAEHLWETTTVGRRGRTTAVRPIKEIRDTLHSAPGGQANHRIAMPEALSLPEAVLPIDPYVLGAWLGDGNRGRGVITNPDSEIFEEIERRGLEVGVPQIDRRTGCPTRTVLGLQTALRTASLIQNKHVPDAYLRGSVAQRLDLLRGLMDTDGTYNKVRSDVAFCSTDKGLAEAVEELALSLGERARIFPVVRKGFGMTVQSYDVKWRPQRYNPFHLPRKADQVDLSRASVRSRQRIIQRVEPIMSVPTQCIAVDSNDRMYLAGRQMVPTHNTGRSPETPEQLGLYATGIELTWGKAYRPTWGFWWDANKGEHSQPMDLTMFTPNYFAALYRQAIAGINAQAFLPQPANNCKAWCGVAEYCAAVKGPKAAGVDPLLSD